MGRNLAPNLSDRFPPVARFGISPNTSKSCTLPLQNPNLFFEIEPYCHWFQVIENFLWRFFFHNDKLQTFIYVFTARNCEEMPAKCLKFPNCQHFCLWFGGCAVIGQQQHDLHGAKPGSLRRKRPSSQCCRDILCTASSKNATVKPIIIIKQSEPQLLLRGVQYQFSLALSSALLS